MNRILEFTPSQEEVLVARVLVLVHQALDEYLPQARQTDRQFIKTVFREDSERTSTSTEAAPDDSEIANVDAAVAQSSRGEEQIPEKNTSNDSQVKITPPPPPPPPVLEAAKQRPAANLAAPAVASSNTLNTDPPDHTQRVQKESTDWLTRVALGLLLAGLVVLTYLLFL